MTLCDKCKKESKTTTVIITTGDSNYYMKGNTDLCGSCLAEFFISWIDFSGFIKKH